MQRSRGPWRSRSSPSAAARVVVAHEIGARAVEAWASSALTVKQNPGDGDRLGVRLRAAYDSQGAHATGTDAGSKIITKVFASVWSFRGFEVRSFWNIDHTTVRMGCAINEAFTNELANGVLITENTADPTVYGMYVNVQKGEQSVTNPTDGALPEIFSILADTGYRVSRERFSSLSPNTPLTLSLHWTKQRSSRPKTTRGSSTGADGLRCLAGPAV